MPSTKIFTGELTTQKPKISNALKYLLSLLFIYCYPFVFGQTTFCLNTEVVSQDASTIILSLQVNGNMAFELGSSNLEFSFDDAAYSNPVLESDGLPGPPFYQVSTVTSPQPGSASYNIELGFPGFGSTMSGPGGFTEVGQVRFTKTGTAPTAPFEWRYTGGTTQTVVFIDDESTRIDATDPTCLVGVPLSALPVTLSKFDALKEGESARLTWKTEEESNNQGFYVQHSTDNVNFRELGFVEGNNEPSEYQFFHRSPESGNNYYRLKQVDYDGKTDFSHIETLFFDSKDQIWTVTPNPAVEAINLVGLEANSSTILEIFDVEGKVVIQETGVNQVDVTQLPHGTYLVRINHVGETIVRKIVIGL